MLTARHLKTLKVMKEQLPMIGQILPAQTSNKKPCIQNTQRTPTSIFKNNKEKNRHQV